MPKAAQFEVCCETCKRIFYVHVKQRNLPKKEQVIYVICPRCKSSWATEITQDSIKGVDYAK